MAKQAEKKEMSMPDLTPMIDVVFQLLIFFMVTAVFAVTPGLDIKLPEAEEAQAPEKENLFIVVDQDGNMKLNHKDVTFATLKDELQEKRRLLDNTTMMIIQEMNGRHMDRSCKSWILHVKSAWSIRSLPRSPRGTDFTQFP